MRVTPVAAASAYMPHVVHEGLRRPTALTAQRRWWAVEIRTRADRRRPPHVRPPMTFSCAPRAKRRGLGRKAGSTQLAGLAVRFNGGLARQCRIMDRWRFATAFRRCAALRSKCHRRAVPSAGRGPRRRGRAGWSRFSGQVSLSALSRWFRDRAQRTSGESRAFHVRADQPQSRAGSALKTGRAANAV
jgi:hypothetical protein